MAETVATRTIAFNNDDQTLQLGLNYRGSSLAFDIRPHGRGPRAGDRAPDARVVVGSDGPGGVFDLLRGPHMSLLGFGTPGSQGCLRGYVITDGGTDAYAPDTLFVIRPDNYVGLAMQDMDESDLTGYLQSLVPNLNAAP
jgi:hypothetical protein